MRKVIALFSLCICFTPTRADAQDSFDVRGGALGAQRPGFFTEDKFTRKRSNSLPANSAQKSARRKFTKRTSDSPPDNGERQQFSLDYIKQITREAARAGDKGLPALKKKAKRQVTASNGPTRINSYQREEQRSTAPYYEPLEKCGQSKVYRLPMANQTISLRMLDTVFYSASSTVQAQQAAKYRGRSLAYRPLVDAAFAYDPDTLWYAFAELANVRCLPTRVHYFASAGGGYIEYREGEAAWR